MAEAEHITVVGRQRRAERLADGSFAAIDEATIIRTAFQPIFRSHDGKLAPVAFEALARPSTGAGPMVPTAYFSSIPDEEQHHSHALVRHVHVRNALHLPHAARRVFLNFDPAILQSPSQAEHAIEMLGEALREAELSPRDVVCEFIENAATDNDALKHLTYALRARGYLIAIDDFGVDASDTKRVAQLTPDIVKFDGGLVRRLLGTQSGFEELARLVDDFRKQGIHSLFEGLEKLEHIEQARRTGVQFLQGFALAPPQIAPGSFDAFMATGEKGTAFPLVKAMR